MVSVSPTAPIWIDLEGAANVRDVGGLPLVAGGVVNSGALIRADNLQGLTPRDVRRLVDELRVRAVADLRTGTEVTNEGPGPLLDEPLVEVTHLSLYPEGTDLRVRETDAGPVVLPWQNRARGDRRSAAQVYVGYLARRPDSIVAALRLIARPDGATVVHCAAGKDRTGVVVALALEAVGVERGSIVDDYARTSERLQPLLERLAASPTYAGEIWVSDPDRHAPRPDTMRGFLGAIDEEHDGAAAWLAAQGWTDADQQALVTKLTS
jgi:protein-tyrosine phosphatase